MDAAADVIFGTVGAAVLSAAFFGIAGWLRDWFAATAIVVASFTTQAVITIPQATARRRLLGLPPSPVRFADALLTVAAEVFLIGVVFYSIGWGLRALRDTDGASQIWRWLTRAITKK